MCQGCTVDGVTASGKRARGDRAVHSLTFELMPSILTIKSLMLSTARNLGIVMFSLDLRSTLIDPIAQRFPCFTLLLQTLHTHSKIGIIQLMHALFINQAG